MRFQRGDNVGPANPRWAGDAVTEQGGRQRARRLFAGDHVCEIEGCGKRAERHHKDGNTRNNDRGNVAFLCNKHHKEADGRMRRPEFRAACSRKGVRLTDEHRAKIAHGLTGRPVSAETRAKMAAARSNYYARRPRPTQCPHGHPYDSANTMTRKNGRYECRECGRQRARNYYNKTRGVA